MDHFIVGELHYYLGRDEEALESYSMALDQNIIQSGVSRASELSYSIRVIDDWKWISKWKAMSVHSTC